MSKVICKRLELIHVSDVNRILGIFIDLKAGKNFTTLPLEESAIYQTNRVNNPAGALLTETVIAKVRINPDEDLLLKISLTNYILRLHTDYTFFCVGSLNSPAILTYSSDKIFVNLSFRAESPLL